MTRIVKQLVGSVAIAGIMLVGPGAYAGGPNTYLGFLNLATKILNHEPSSFGLCHAMGALAVRYCETGLSYGDEGAKLLRDVIDECANNPDIQVNLYGDLDVQAACADPLGL